MAPYTVEEYLLDRALMTDTTTKLWLTYDLKLSKEETIARLKKDVLSPQVHVDYVILLGGEPYNISDEGLADEWFGLMSKLTGTVHLIGHPINDLPVPDGEVERPTKATVLRPFMVVLKKGEKTGQNGGVMRIEVTRGEGKGNTWRISALSPNNLNYNMGDNVFE